MAELKKVQLPNKILTEEVIYKSLNAADIVNEHFSITDLPKGEIGTAADLPSATVVFDLSGSSLSVRANGAKKFAAETQYLFKVLTDIIYRNHGIVEKFPGDGISMHFPANKFGKDGAIHNACEAIMQMDHFLNTRLRLGRDKYRFTLTYGEDTIITKFGSLKHLELISIGHAVNVAHKLEKKIKDENCFIGMDDQCKMIAEKLGFSDFSSYLMPSDLMRNVHSRYEFWFGVKF
ncbi:hypothetical protein MZM54_29500 [[Brevibacterium] frigoritolerans]|nr:hypothetical protein [Peribacillus frigoritolerans]